MELMASASFVNVNLIRDPSRPPDVALAVVRPQGLTEESLVADARAELSPAQMVERKLASLLKNQPLPVSHMMTARRISRSH